jgi:selenocysteine lyase/cysteine desulfurase
VIFETANAWQSVTATASTMAATTKNQHHRSQLMQHNTKMVLNDYVASCLRDDKEDEDFQRETTATRSQNSQVVYLNNAAQARLSDSVIQAGRDALHRQPWESGGAAAAESQRRVRQLFAKIIEADESNIAIHPSTAFAVTMAAENILREHSQSTTTRKYKILLLQDEFYSAVYPWQNIVHRSNGQLQLEIVPYPDQDNYNTLNDENWTWTDGILKRLEDSILAVCLPPLHWSDGSLIDLQRISVTCKELNVYFIVDSTQATGIYPCSVRELLPDMLCCSVHKWLRGPSGASLVYIDPKLHDSWEPLDQHARGRQVDADEEAKKNQMQPDGYPAAFLSDARKFDAGGKADPIHLPILAAALEEVATINVTQAQETLATILQPLIDWCATHGYTRPASHANHLVGIRPSHLTIEEMVSVATNLAQEQEIYIAVRCGSFRISPYLDTTAAEIQKLVQALAKVSREC